MQDGEVKIVDEFTGRIMEGRRWSEGLHQAVEAKEGVKIEAENITVATVTIQNYFRMYERLAGMTGTASTEANEFGEIYKLEVVSIPTNVPMIRNDQNDVVFKTKEEKFAAVADDIAERHQKGQPVLVGTISIEISEMLSNQLVAKGIPHNVLNAKQHEREAEIIVDAGQKGAVTIATNMAGRGVDIKLGEGVPGGRRPVRARHRAARVAAHRQPAARSVGPPGRPGRDAVLPVRRGRRRAAVRRRPHLQDPRPAEGARGRADRALDARRTASRARRSASRSTTSRSARTSSSTTTC